MSPKPTVDKTGDGEEERVRSAPTANQRIETASGHFLHDGAWTSGLFREPRQKVSCVSAFGLGKML